MKLVRKIVDLLVVFVATALLGMLSYLSLGGKNLPQKFIPFGELVLVLLFLLAIIFNSSHYWRNVKLLIFGMSPLIALIASAVLPQYFDIRVPIVASIVFYVYLLYWHLYLAVTEMKRTYEAVETIQVGKPGKKSTKKGAKPAKS